MTEALARALFNQSAWAASVFLSTKAWSGRSSIGRMLYLDLERPGMEIFGFGNLQGGENGE
ncbi:MAG: hypothetical protein R6X08_03000 [Desulfosalsimonadaceae bacterium]